MFWNVILIIFPLLVAGLICKKGGILTPLRVSLLNKLAFNILVPALIFNSTHARTFGEIFSLKLVLGFYIVISLTLILGWFFFRRIQSNAKKSVAIIQSALGNINFIGLPIVSTVLGKLALAKASFLGGIAPIIQFPFAMLFLVYMNNPESRIKNELRRAFLNPIVGSLFVGLLFSQFHLLLPTLGERVVSLLARGTLPVTLLGVGASLDFKKQTGSLKYSASVTCLKLLFMPLFGWLIFSLLQVGSLSLKTGVIMLSMPTAVYTFIYAKEFGADAEFASINITTTTLLSILTISAFLVVII
ncbi:MAG: AEC family transporter [Candidatus Korarchaeota archaeon]|nr:AEC family transporter [Candidatus Korarchaeota archaeon]NIU84537.1 hypothetical protein [Candidatus Thorarchaeota archaeon]NIW14604.1 hypothetical protein [Candidatus Thorarchaeota archaeon]NIW52676.1 hypothetical protein [Candidatus Korarchaeota archaeon]